MTCTRGRKGLQNFSVVLIVLSLLLYIKENCADTGQINLNSHRALASEKNILDFLDPTFHSQIRSGNYTTLDSEFLTMTIQKAFDSIPTGGTIYFPTGRYVVTRGFQLFDQTTIRGESREKVIIQLKEHLPARTSEATQTAFFTGKNAYSYTHTGGTNGITIRDISLDANRQYDPNIALLGGIRFINSVRCKISNVDISNVQSFGIILRATSDGQGAKNNEIVNNRIHLVREWYLPNGGINPTSLIGIALGSSTYGENNGADKSLTRIPGKYIISKSNENLIEGNFVEGGSHAIGLSNAMNNTIRHNITTNSSHRGIILSSTADHNLIEDNQLSDHGSTGIHLAYNSDRNIVRKNRVQGTRAIAEGDGIKAYVNCNGNLIEENVVVDIAKAGIRIGHGANDNIIRKNEIINTKGVMPSTVGIKISAMFEAQRKVPLTDNTSQLTADRNKVIGNKINGTYRGILLTDEGKIPRSVRDNVIRENTIENTSIAIDSSGVLGSQVDNTISSNIFHQNARNITTDLLKSNKVSSNTRH
jgi:parallel beta-helix repeat protein